MRVTPQADTINTFDIGCAAGVQTYPAVVFNGTDYIAVWSDCRLGMYYINTALITTSGTIPGPNYWIGVSGSNDEDSPDIAYDGSRCLGVWSEENVGVRGRFINNAGEPEDTVLTIAPFTITTYTAPAIASDGSNYLVVWFERTAAGDWDIFGQLVSAQGSLVGAPILIAAGANSQYDADVLFDGASYFVVYRETTYYIFGQRIDINGNLVGAPIPVSEQSGIYRYQPTLVNSPEHYFIVWSEYRGNYFDVYGNIDIVPFGAGELSGSNAGHYAALAPTISRGLCRLRYAVEAESRTRIVVCDAAGRIVRYLLDSHQMPGEYCVEIPAHALGTGVYFIRIETGGTALTRKLTVIH